MPMDPAIIERVRIIASRYNAVTPASVEYDDLVQEGLIAAWQAGKRWDGRGDMLGWIDRRVRGAMMDYVRKAGGVPRDHWKIGVRLHIVDIDSVGPIYHPTVTDDIYVEEIISLIGKSDLPECKKKVLMACTIGDKTYRRAGLESGVNESRISQVMQEAGDEMRTYLRKRTWRRKMRMAVVG